MMQPITKFAADGVVDRAGRRHDRDGRARMLQRRLRARPISKSRATCSTARSTSTKAVLPQPGHYRASTNSIGDPARHREARRHPGQRRAAGHPLRPAGLDLPRPRRGHRAAAWPRHSRLLQRRRPRLAAAGRPAPFRSHALAGLRQGRRDRHRRHAVRLPHGLRQAHQRADAGADRPGLPHRRQEPRHRSRHRRRSGRHSRRGAAGGQRPDRKRQAPGAHSNG